jgi:hypothetical protein
MFSESWNYISYSEWHDNVTELYPNATFESHADGIHAQADGMDVGLHRHDGSARMGDEP